MTREDMDALGEVVRTRSGMVLTPDKLYLVDSRLGPLARREGFDSVETLVAALRRQPDDRLAWAVTDALTTNETTFFRDKVPFQHFRDVTLPALAAARPGGTVRVWSTGCATGQEPYSLAMMAAELAGTLPGLKLDICASDISERCLEKARAGIYTQFEVQRGLPIAYLVHYFDKVEETWRIKPELRGAIRWRRFNLLDDMRPLGRFDAVFCRNVLIYLDPDTRARVLDGLAGALAPDGALILGAGETVSGLSDKFEAAGGPDGLFKPKPLERAA